jgi:hypothetical protein
VRILLGVGLILLILGIVLLFVPVRHRVRHGIDAGPVSIGVTTTEREKVHPAVSGVLIAGGVALMIAGGRKRS